MSDPKKPKRQFFLVFCPEGPAMPVKTHETHKAAFFECHRMSQLHPGQQFFVMASASKAIIDSVPLPSKSGE